MSPQGFALKGRVAIMESTAATTTTTTTLKIHETFGANGVLEEFRLVAAATKEDSDCELLLETSVGGVVASSLPLPNGAIDAVMKRYGAEIDPAQRITLVASLLLRDGRAIKHIRHLEVYDVIARDYLIVDQLCAVANTIAGALTHLAQANAKAKA